jgi:hypothetical protein
MASQQYYPQFSEAYTLTFGDRAENHKGMQIIGTAAAQGFTETDLLNAREWFVSQGRTCHIYDIRTLLPQHYQTQAAPAYLLVAYEGLAAIVDIEQLYLEQQRLAKDTQALMYGRVVNKHARHNLCFADHHQVANYQAGQGTVVAFSDVPYLNYLRGAWSNVIGDSAANLYAEGNYYYDPQRCGIGYHGDSERKKVVAVRLGAHIPLCYQWYQHSQPVGQRGIISLGDGDIYMMSDKAVGYDWKSKNILTLRHAAGSDKYITPS